MSQRRPWYLYVVECTDGTLYTGISTDVERRLKEHNAGRGARYTSSRRPVLLQAVWCFASQTTAMQAESAFKRKSRSAKVRTITAQACYREGSWLSSDSAGS